MVGVPAAFKSGSDARQGSTSVPSLRISPHLPSLHRIVISVGVGLIFAKIVDQPYLIVVQHRRAGLHESCGGCTASAVGAGVAAASAVPAGCGVPAVSAVPGRGAAVDGTAAEETAPRHSLSKSIDKAGNKDLFTVTPPFLFIIPVWHNARTGKYGAGRSQILQIYP